MLGSLNPASRQVTIVGAGFAGLVAAYELDRRGYDVELHEEAARAGGLLGTVHTPQGLVERAAHSFLASSALQDLCRELGLALVPVRPKSRARYVWRRGSLRRFPLSAFEALGLVARVVFRRAGRSEYGMSLEEWGRIHLGRPATENLLAPFLRGIYAAPPDALSVSAAFPQLAVPGRWTLLRTLLELRRSRRRSGERRPPMQAPQAGMGALVAALERRLEERLGERFHRDSPVRALPGGCNVILAVPAYRAAELLREASPELACKLREVEYSPLLSATMFARASQFARVPRGVGVLTAPGEDSRVLGILFNSSAFEGRVNETGCESPQSLVSLTAMLGGADDPAALSLPDEEITREIAAALARLFGFSGAAERVEIHRWPRAIPKYSPELEHVWGTALETWCAHPGHVLFGNYTGQVSLRGMAEVAASRFREELLRRSQPWNR